MPEMNAIDDVAEDVVQKLSQGKPGKTNMVLLYAFNGTGKTRLANHIQEDSEKMIALSYGVFFEDLFTWDNENYELTFPTKDVIITFLRDQYLEGKITDNFQKLIRAKIFPNFDLDSGRIRFDYLPGDDREERGIKISRGEESLFISSVFYTVLEEVISLLNTKKEDRESNIFNDLKYIIIDDPVSSIDDTKIITMSVELSDIMKKIEVSDVAFLITTHHALFYNVLCNEIRHGRFNTNRLILSKVLNGYKLDKQDDESPFSYHIAMMDEIRKAISDGGLKKYHFNLFRGVLEKTANFLGYDKYYDCLEVENRNEINRLVNLYSHGKLSELESRDFPDEHKEIFKKAFNDFLRTFRWKIGNDQTSI